MGFAKLMITIFLALTASCQAVSDTVDKLLSFSITRDIEGQTVEGSLLPCQVVNALNLDFFGLNNVVVSKEQDFPEQDTEVRLITKAQLKTFHLTTSAASAEQNWNWLDAITFKIKASGLPDIRVAYLDPVPDELTQLTMTIPKQDVAPYIKADGGFTFVTTATGCPPQQDHEFTGQIVIDVSANPL